jgi:hypothetical protein
MPAGPAYFCISDACHPTYPKPGHACAYRSSVVYFPHMAPKKTTLNELGEMLTHVVKHMATKDDIGRLDTRIDKLDEKIDSVESNLGGKIDRLDTKLTKYEENEIDKRLQLEVRVSHIEKQLSIDKKIAA